MLYVRPSSWCFELKVCVQRSRVCPGSVGTRQALLQCWLCVSALCALQKSLPWCVGYTSSFLFLYFACSSSNNLSCSSLNFISSIAILSILGHTCSSCCCCYFTPINEIVFKIFNWKFAMLFDFIFCWNVSNSV